jgi:hypothetical protein
MHQKPLILKEPVRKIIKKKKERKSIIENKS